MDAHEKPGDRAPISARPDRRALRGFGLTFAIVFMLFGTFFWWKDRFPFARSFWALAAIFAATAFAVPTALLSLHGPWMRFADILGRFNTKLLLGLFYFTGMTVIGRLMLLFGTDPMSRSPRRPSESYWIKTTPHSSGTRHFEQQF
jgi:hypothetical protein